MTDGGVGERRDLAEMAVGSKAGGSGIALLSAGFRPFFLLAGAWALIVLPVSLGRLLGAWDWPSAYDPLRWHFHEMVFGYVAAVLAGFLLTAIPNWTGRLPLKGGRLLALVGLWLAGRLGMAVSGVIGPLPAAVLDILFLLALLLSALREIVAGGNWRNLPLIAVLGLFLLSNLLFHAVSAGLLAQSGVGEGADVRSALACLAFLIAIVGGRIVPSFTRNWLAKRSAGVLPAPFGAFDRLTLLATLAALLLWVLLPDGVLCGLALIAAAALNLIRLLRWRGLPAAGEPLLWVLHVGYLWIPVALALLGWSALAPDLPQTAGIHALGVGAIGTMTLGVMSRATLGHTGQALSAGPGLTAAFCLITLAAAARVAAALWSAATLPLLHGSAAAWMAAFACFLATCGPILLGRRAGRSAGAEGPPA